MASARLLGAAVGVAVGAALFLVVCLWYYGFQDCRKPHICVPDTLSVWRETRRAKAQKTSKARQ